MLPAGYQPGLKARKFLMDTITENLDLIKQDLQDPKCAPVLLAPRHSTARCSGGQGAAATQQWWSESLPCMVVLRACQVR